MVDHRHVLASVPFASDLFQRFSVHNDLALARRAETREHRKQRRFATAGLPDDRVEFSRLKRAGDVFQRLHLLVFALVGIAHIFRR